MFCNFCNNEHQNITNDSYHQVQCCRSLAYTDRLWWLTVDQIEFSSDYKWDWDWLGSLVVPTEWQYWSTLGMILSPCLISSMCTTCKPLLGHRCPLDYCHLGWTEEKMIKLNALHIADYLITCWSGFVEEAPTAVTLESCILSALSWKGWCWECSWLSADLLVIITQWSVAETRGHVVCLLANTINTCHVLIFVISLTCISHTGDTSAGEGLSRGRGWDWGQQPRTGSENFETYSIMQKL